MNDTNDRLTALESINMDQLTAVRGGAGDDGGSNNPPGGGKTPGAKIRGGIAGYLFDKVVGLAFQPPSKEFNAYMQYQMEARRSRLLSDAYRGGTGN
jgi:hypothetical protein